MAEKKVWVERIWSVDTRRTAKREQMFGKDKSPTDYADDSDVETILLRIRGLVGPHTQEACEEKARRLY